MKTAITMIVALAALAAVLLSPAVAFADDNSDIDRDSLRDVFGAIHDSAKAIRDLGREYAAGSESFRQDLRDAREENGGIGDLADDIKAKLGPWEQLGNIAGKAFPWAAGILAVGGMVFGADQLRRRKKPGSSGSAGSPGGKA